MTDDKHKSEEELRALIMNPQKGRRKDTVTLTLDGKALTPQQAKAAVAEGRPVMVRVKRYTYDDGKPTSVAAELMARSMALPPQSPDGKERPSEAVRYIAGYVQGKEPIYKPKTVTVENKDKPVSDWDRVYQEETARRAYAKQQQEQQAKPTPKTEDHVENMAGVQCPLAGMTILSRVCKECPCDCDSRVYPQSHPKV